MFPPLLAPREPTRDDALHPVDRFFCVLEKQVRILGTTRLGDTKVLVLEHRNESEPWTASSNSEVKYALIKRAYVDPARGYLPCELNSDQYEFIRNKTWMAIL